MSPRRPRSFAYGLAMLAWLAQLLLPAAHGAAMRAAGSPWCGVPSVQLQAQLRELPAALRAAQQDGATKVQQLAQCLDCCAAFSAQATPPPRAALLLPPASLDAAMPPHEPARCQRFAPLPPVRGPPSYS